MINTMLSTRNHTPTFAVLHGSQATGHAHQNSDWDGAILRDHVLTTEERAELRRAFALKLGVREDALDVSDLRSDAPILRYRVAMHGRLIEGDPKDFRAFQIRAWKDYLNNAKFLALGTQFLRKALS
jgi:predicted nucleotidyltransferase